jgi:menaquinone-dependent protoporphyrinogen oxidase
MKPVLIAYTTNSGSTEEVARAIGEEMEKDGQPVEIHRLEEVDSLEPYSAIVIGAPMIIGWHRTALGFIKKHQKTLSGMKVALFATAMSLTQPAEGWSQPVSLCLDPDLAHAPINPRALSLKERYTIVPNYLGPILRAAPAVHPVSVAFFGGKLEMFRLVWWQALFVMLIIRAQPGDYRNWDCIRAWSKDISGYFSS